MKNKINSFQKSKILSAAILATLPGIASAAMQLDEIIVTAQKRSESLQDVPLSISALQPDMLEQHGVTTVEGLGEAIPGLTISRQLIGVAPIIRGIGQANLAPGAELGVATYVDGVYNSSSTGSNLGLGNIERIEILRGPQGTLFGRNATGGLLHIITKNPEQEFGGNASIAVSDPEIIESKIYLTGPLTDSVSANFAAVVTEQNEGYGTNLGTGKDTYLRDETLLRGKLLFDIDDTSSLILAADYADLETDVALTRRYADFSVARDGTKTPIVRPDGVPNPPGFWDVNTPDNDYATNEQWGLQATYDKSFSAFDTKVIAAYRELESLVVLEQSWTYLPLVDFTSPAEEQTFTLEGQLISNDSSSFEWILGLYYLDAKPAVTGINAVTNFGTGHFYSTSHIDTQSIAAFGQATFELTEKASVTTGLRWTRDEKELTAAQQGVAALPSSVKADDSWSKLTYRLAFDYAFSDAVLGYISYNRGFKSGIYNLFELPIPLSPAVAPEVVDTFELGIKADLLDERLRINAALYHNDYTDIQLQTTVQGLNLLTNAGEATTYGGELEINYLATETLQLYANAAYTHTEYDSFPNAQFFVPNTGQCLPPGSPLFLPVNCPGVGEAAGNQFSNIPEVTFNVGAIYEQSVSFGAVGFSANYFWSDERVYGFNNIHTEDAYSVVTADVFAKFGSAQEHEIRLQGRNLTDEEYISLYQPSTINTVVDPNPGRTITLKYSYEF